MDTKKTALYNKHVALGAKIVSFAGYEMPLKYDSQIIEHNTVRNGVGVFDVSHMGEFMIRGPHALELIQKVTSNDASKLIPGKAQYSCLPNDQGGIVDDLLVYMIKEKEYMLVVNGANIQKDWNWISDHNQIEAEMENISDDITLLAIQGPKAIHVLNKLTSLPLEEMGYYTFSKGNILKITDGAIISATGYTGSGGFEIYIYNEYASAIWDAIFDAGQKEGIKPIGLAARDTLRLEMGFCLYGNDLDDKTSPIEAGLGWITKLTKDFTSADLFKKQKREGVSQKLVGFKMIGRGIPRHGYELYNTEDEHIGHVTSGTMSPSLGFGIGMGYVKTDFAKPGTKISILIRNKKITAEITRPPFYKP